MLRKISFAAAVLFAGFLFGQAVVDNTDAVKTIPFRVSALEPGSCATGQYYWNLTTNVVRRCISANVWADANLPAVRTSTTSPITVSMVGWHLNNSTGAITYNLPLITTGTIGAQYCFRNAVTRTGAITLKAPVL